MVRRMLAAMLGLGCVCSALAQGTVASTPPKFDAFEVATIKPGDNDPKGGRYLTVQGIDRFVGKNYTLKLLLAAAYDINPKTISGGPAWMDSERFDIQAVSPGTVRPDHDQQMAMLRELLTSRFQVTFHREQKVFSIYVLEVASGGPKLKPTTAEPDAPVVVGPGVVYPQRVVLPGRNATMGNFVSLLQRAILDRPVVDRTGLTGRYDFDLEWAPDETQFGGGVPAATETATSPPLFVAVQQQMGLKLEATRGPVQTMVVDKAERPTAN